MPISDGKYVVPAWQDGGAPAITAQELTDIGQSIVQNQNNIATLGENKLDKAGGAISGSLSIQQNLTTTGQTTSGGLNVTGASTLNGAVNLGMDPSTNMQAVTKQYADAIRNLITKDMAYFQITFKSGNTLIKNTEMYTAQSGVIDVNNNNFTTNEYGQLFVLCPPNQQVTFNILNRNAARYIDVSGSIVLPPSAANTFQSVYASANINNYVEYTTAGTQNIAISGSVSRIDVCCVGGGGAGRIGHDGEGAGSTGGGGGGGGGVTIKESAAFTPNTSIQITVGAGGIADGSSTSKSGGSTSFGSITASGGEGTSGQSGGSGGTGTISGGSGGLAGYSSQNGNNAPATSAYRYSSFSGTTPCSGGGGGGAGQSNRTPLTGGSGANNGGKGGDSTLSTATTGTSATSYGGGGGGGSVFQTLETRGGNGYDGYIGVRIYH